MSSFPDLTPPVDPRSVTVIGAEADKSKVSGRIAEHLLGGKFGGEFYLVNAKFNEIDGRRCYPSVTDVPEPVDVAVVMIPPARGSRR